jgi:uncharacterized protein
MTSTKLAVIIAAMVGLVPVAGAQAVPYSADHPVAIAAPRATDAEKPAGVQDADGPSFDCAKAHSRAEHLICEDPELSDLDVSFARDYKQAKEVVADKAAFVREGHSEWQQREACLDKACLFDWYTRRGNQLADLFFSTHTPEEISNQHNCRAHEQPLDMKRYHRIAASYANRHGETEQQFYDRLGASWADTAAFAITMENCGGSIVAGLQTIDNFSRVMRGETPAMPNSGAMVASAADHPVAVAAPRGTDVTDRPVARAAASATDQLALGLSQNQFCTVVRSYIRDYLNAWHTNANQAGLSQLRYNRKRSLSTIINSGQVTSWTGEVSDITTDYDGTGRLTAKLSCGAETHSEDILLYSKPGIELGTALYATLISFTRGRKITFSGAFVIKGSSFDYIDEESITELGSMTRPEFVFEFQMFSPAP